MPMLASSEASLRAKPFTTSAFAPTIG